MNAPGTVRTPEKGRRARGGFSIFDFRFAIEDLLSPGPLLHRMGEREQSRIWMHPWRDRGSRDNSLSWLGLLLFSGRRQRIFENIFQEMSNAKQNDRKLLTINELECL